MKKVLLSILTLAVIGACNDNSKSGVSKPGADSTASRGNTTAVATTANDILTKMLGSFVGPFGDNKITLLITKLMNDSVEGRSVVGGNNRPFVGTYASNSGVYSFTAKEPGDDPNDGVFHFSIDSTKTDMVTGSWKPNDTKKPEKDYSLERKAFKYDTTVGTFPEASQRLLQPKDVDNMIKEDLSYMRNEIFARHGYCFKKKATRQMFEVQPWYVPNTTDIRNLLTDIEKKNIDLIKRYEKYAVDYGDEYGR